jgi:hypothetical protein
MIYTALQDIELLLYCLSFTALATLVGIMSHAVRVRRAEVEHHNYPFYEVGILFWTVMAVAETLFGFSYWFIRRKTAYDQVIASSIMFYLSSFGLAAAVWGMRLLMAQWGLVFCFLMSCVLMGTGVAYYFDNLISLLFLLPVLLLFLGFGYRAVVFLYMNRKERRY